MDVKYQVFVSSTFEDLREERRLVMEQILNLGHIPVGMELFQASDETQWAHIKRRISSCDYYIVIIAERYGSQVRGKSFTRMEYEFALKEKVPVVAFLLNESARKNWPQSKIDFGNKEKLQAFRKYCQRKLVRYWSSADELAAQVTTSLVQLIQDRPRAGWVRADTVPQQAAMNEFARLSEEKRVLQTRVEELQAAALGVNIPPIVKRQIETLAKKKLSSMRLAKDIQPNKDMSLLQLFMILSRSLAMSLSEKDLLRIVKANFFDDGTVVTVRPIVAEFIARDILKSESKLEYDYLGNHESYIELELSNFGKQFLGYAELWAEEGRGDID